MNTTSHADSVDFLVGQRLRTIRQGSGVAPEILAEVVGVSPQQLEQLEMGKENLTAGHLFKLSEFFKVSPNYFFEGILSYAGERPVSEDDVHYLIQNFLKVDAPDRGAMFKNFVKAVTKDQEE